MEKSDNAFSTLQYNAQFKIFEPLEYKYDVCEAILLWEQVSLPLLLVLLWEFALSAQVLPVS